MIVPQSYVVALLMVILTMLCWGSWANVVKMVKGWRFELLYFDYALGILLASVSVEPDPLAHAVYQQVYPLFRKLYFGFGDPEADAVAARDVLPALRRLAAEARVD
jgi:hypothetical protein